MINWSQGTFITWEELLNKGFEGERSPTSALGAVTLPYKVSGSIVTLVFPSEGALVLPSSFLGSAIGLWCPFWGSVV
jgi:hypothetical protein